LNPERWVDAYGDALFGFALVRVQNREAAEDLVQETYFAALRSRKSFQGRSSEKTWLFGILKHKILDYFRRPQRTLYLGDVGSGSGRREMPPAAGGGRGIHPADPGTDPERSYHYREFLDHLQRGLAKLPRRAAEVFVSREIDGLSTEEICGLFGISRFNCWTILHRARRLLRKRLEFEGFKPSA
jgi:RNA polymerase sigma-70 factor (ECF subfamily)